MSTSTSGDSRAFRWRARSVRSALARLARSKRRSSNSSRDNVFTTRANDNDSSATDASSPSFCLTARAAVLILRESPLTSTNSNGAIDRPMRLNRRSSQNITTSMPTMRDHVEHHSEYGRRDEGLDRLDVAGEADDQVPRPLFFVERHRHPLYVVIEHPAQIAADLGPDGRRQRLLHVRARRSEAAIATTATAAAPSRSTPPLRARSPCRQPGRWRARCRGRGRTRSSTATAPAERPRSQRAWPQTPPPALSSAAPAGASR